MKSGGGEEKVGCENGGERERQPFPTFARMKKLRRWEEEGFFGFLLLKWGKQHYAEKG